MTEIIDDNVQIRCLIGDEHWHISELEVELSQASTPNYVHIVSMVPAADTDVPNDLQDLRGRDFELSVDTSLESESRSSDSSTLFIGKLANISNIDGYAYEGIAYDPSQQAFSGLGSDNTDLESGSLLNQRVLIAASSQGRSIEYTYKAGTRRVTRTKKASDVIDTIMEQIPSIDEYDNQLQEGGVDRGNTTGAYNPEILFKRVDPTVGQALEKIANETKSEYWFDKHGVFHIGLPDPIAHELSLITDASAGVNTPAYQSVRVVGSGIASEKGQRLAHIEPKERFVVEGTIGITGNNKYQPILSPDRLPEPIFTYRSNEINTQKQAKNVAKSIINKLGKQESDGKITVTGFPEIEPFDVVVMPQNDDPDGINYQPNQGMGGQRYAVHKVVHRINPSDGFKTIIHVSGIVGASKVAVPEEETPDQSTDQLEERELGGFSVEEEIAQPTGLTALSSENLSEGPTDSDQENIAEAFDETDGTEDETIGFSTEDVISDE